jgi:hypothetical protein
MKTIALTLILLLGLPLRLFAAVGCDLNDPDRDVARLFPGSTGYKTRYASIKDSGGQALLEKVEARLGDRFQGLYETMDVPYTVYEVLKGQSRIGYIHGVNQKGVYGGLQVFLVLDLSGVIKGFYFQKLTSRHAKSLRSPEFGRQFEGLSLKDFSPSGYPDIKNPAPGAEKDFRAALRGVKKNLILMDELVLGGRK